MASIITRRRFIEFGALAGGAAALGLAGCAGGRAFGGAASSAASSQVGASVSSASSPAASIAASAAGDVAASSAPQEAGASSEPSGGQASSAPAGAGGNLVLIYSRAGENYLVGNVEVGNTMVLAQMISEKTGADLFELEPVVPYPENYDECTDYALEEQHQNGRPELKALPDLSAYDTIYFGFPVWWEDIPMPVYTAIEALDWTGKTIAPFNTHEGSGNAGMFNTLANVCAGSTVLDGLTMTGTAAQQQRDQASAQVDEWLASLEV